MPGTKQVFMSLLTSSAIDLKAIETKQSLVMLASKCLSRKQLRWRHKFSLITCRKQRSRNYSITGVTEVF